MSAPAGPPGWHGKLPSLGDFASRRLDGGFIEAWDAWLSAGLVALRQASPEGWLAAYLASPSWRFLLMPGVMPGQAGAQAWAGVLMPSVDRVGRYFPFTVAQPLAAGPASASQNQGLWSWLARLDELARDALFDDWTAERLEHELARLPAHGVGPLAPGPPAGKALLEEAAGGVTDAATQIGIEAHQAWAAQAQGRAWWQASPDDAPARLLLSRGLPPAHAMPRLFGPAATIAASAPRRRP